MKRLTALMVGGLVLGACGRSSESELQVVRGTRSADGQTGVPEYFGSKGYIMTDEYLETAEGGALVSTLRRLGTRFIAVLTGDSVPFQPLEIGVGGIEVRGWNPTRWARDVGPVSAVSHSSEDLRLVQLGSLTNAGRAIAKWLGRELVAGPSVPYGADFLINGYADCFVSRSSASSRDGDEAAGFRDQLGCRRVTFLDSLKSMPVTTRLSSWARFLSNDTVAIARLVDFTGDEALDQSSKLVELRRFWDDQARAMEGRGYAVIRLPVFVHQDGNKRLFSSTIAGLIVKRHYLAPHFPSLEKRFGERYEAEQGAIERELRFLRFAVEWVAGEESSRLGGSIHRAVLPVHDNS